MDRKWTLLNGFYLKIVGLLTMTLNHLGLFLNYAYPSLEPIATVFILIGRIAFPIFVFLLTEGMYYSKNKKSYLTRLGFLALLIIVGSYLLNVFYPLPIYFEGNPITTLFLIGLTIYCLSLEGNKKFYSIIPISYVLISYIVATYELASGLTILWFPIYLRADYSLLGLLLGLGFYYSRNLLDYFVSIKKPYGLEADQFKCSSDYRLFLNLVCIGVLLFVICIFWVLTKLSLDASGFSYLNTFDISRESYCLLSALFILFYNGSRGYDSKNWRIFSYLYFPLHLVILFIVFVLL